MIVNGMQVEGTPKQVEFPIKGKAYNLTMAHISADSAIDCEFQWVEAPEGVTIISRKLGGLIATTMIKDGVILFDSLTAASVFTVLEVAFGWSNGKAKSVYAKSNPQRKESKKAPSANKVILEAGALG